MPDPQKNNTSTKDERPPVKGMLEWVKQHPAVLLGISALTGIGGDQLTTLLQEDQPGWLLGGVVLLWAAIHWGKKVADNIVALVNEFRDFRDETRERLSEGDGLLADLVAARDAQHEYNEQISLLWDIHESEIQAYREKRRRETEKVEKENDDA